MENKRGNETKKTVWTALLSTLALIFMHLDFPLPIFPSFLKVDLSDLPPLVASFFYGPGTGVLVELVKNLLHLFTTTTAGVGELGNFLVGAAFVAPAGIIYRRHRTKQGALRGLAVGTIFMTVAGGFANYFILIPFYSCLVPIEQLIAMSAAVIPAVHDTFTLVLYGVVPFNLLKGAIISLLTLQLYKRFGRIMRHEKEASQPPAP